METRQRTGLFLIFQQLVSPNYPMKQVKKYKFAAAIVLICLAVVSIILPYKSYYPWFIFTSDHKIYERVLGAFMQYSISGKIDLLVVFSPAMAVVITRTWLARSITVLLIISLLTTWMSLVAGFGLRFALFEAYTKYLAGYYLFILLSISGCLAFWGMTAYQAWYRIYRWRQNLKAA